MCIRLSAFFKAIESHKHLLNTPIIDNYVTVASAIQSYLRYQYESVMGSSGYKNYMPYVCLLLSATSVNSCEGSRKMKVVHTKGTELVRSSDAKNLMLAKDLAMEFIDSGYDVIMRDGEDLVVYSNTDNSLQEYVPKSLHKVFYDVDKLDLLPLSYYVYMCK